MEPKNLIIILSDKHSRDASGCYGHPSARTPNIDSLSNRGATFTNAYTNCPICIPARAAIATGEYVHNTGYWDNGQPYDGVVESWHHVLRSRGLHTVAIGKLHFKGKGTDHGFTEEIDPLHVVEGIGDVLGCVRDDPPPRHKRPGIEEAGSGDSTYIRYDAANADAAITWLNRHAADERPWVLFLGFVLPHPPYIAPADMYEHYSLDEIALPPQWDAVSRPEHPVIRAFRDAFDFTDPFLEETVRRVNAAYLGACEYLDSQVGRVLITLDELDLANSTRILYTSDHGEDCGARGLFGKFTMYEESAAIPMILAGPDIPSGRAVSTPVSLIDIYPTVLESVGIAAPMEKPGTSLYELISGELLNRSVFSEYHAIGSRHGLFMFRYGAYKYVRYIGAPEQLFDLERDPSECTNLADDPRYADVVADLAGRLRTIVDPDDADSRARADQARVVSSFGGRDALIARGAFDNSPVPGEKPKFHV